MITGFEEITPDLTPEEKAQCRVLWRIMNQAFAAGKTISNAQIRKALKQKHGITIGGPKVRKMIAWMHNSGHLPGLIASGKGYSRARSLHDLLKYEQSLKERISAQVSRLKTVQADLNSYEKNKIFSGD